MNGGEAADLKTLLFSGISAVFVETRVQPRRLQVWKEKLQQKGGVLAQHISRTITHIFAADLKSLLDRFSERRLRKLHPILLRYDWIEECLISGYLVPTGSHILYNPSSDQSEEVWESSVISEGKLIVDHPAGNNDDKDMPPCQEDLQERDNTLNSRKSPDLSADDLTKKKPLDRKDKDIGHQNRRLLQSVPLDRSFCQKSGFLVEEQIPINKPEPVYTPSTLNENITVLFEDLQNIYKALGDVRRSHSYHKAISVLEKVPFKITSVEEVKQLPDIGRSLLDHIDEILKTGSVSKLQHFKNDEKVRTITLLSSVWGIGGVTAKKLYDKGHRSLEDLRMEESLSYAQKIGLKFHDDINKKIPRHEVKEMETLMRKLAEDIEPNIIVVCGGSYRRGKAFVGDIDIVITHPDGHSHAGFLHKFSQKLKDCDFLSEDLLIGFGNSSEERRVDTYFGLCRYFGREQRHRIDLKVYPFEKYPFGLIAWTGNDVLNRRLRIAAEKKGYRLDDEGLYPLSRDDHGEQVAKRNRSMPCKTERDVFDALGFPWLEPHERNL